MIIEIALKRPIGNPKMLGRVLLREGDPGSSAQIVTSLTQVYVLVHGGDQPGHIAQDCMAHFADDSMRARFPKKEKTKRTPIKH